MRFILPAIGGYFGGPIGWLAGSLLANLLDPQQGPDIPNQFGPRLTDLKVQTSTYGIAIPRAFGTVRIAGNMIWAEDITEHVTETTIETDQGGKGGGGGDAPTQTTYSYTGTFAIAICEGPIVGIRKVWANGKLIIDSGDDSDFMSIIASSQAMVIYLGDEEQTADPTIFAVHGNQTPAYRGTAYIVFNDLPLADFGNRHPNLEFEVVVSGDEEVLVPYPIYDIQDTPTLFNHPADNQTQITPGGTYAWHVMEEPDDESKRLVLVNNYTGQTLLTKDFDLEIWLAGVSATGDAWIEYNHDQVFKVSQTGEATEYDGFGILNGTDFRLNQLVEVEDSDTPLVFWEYNHPSPNVVIVYRTQPSDTSTTEPVTIIGSRQRRELIQRPDRIPGRIYITMSGTDPAILGYVGNSVGDSLDLEVVRTYTQGNGNKLFAFCGSDGYIYARSLNNDEANVLEKLDPDGAVVDSCTLPGIAVDAYSTDTRFAQDDVGNLYVQVGTKIFRVVHGTMDVDASADFGATPYEILPGDPFEGVGIFVMVDDADQQTVRLIGPDRIISDPPLLSEVVTTLCELGGLDSSDLDVSQLTGIDVLGYVIARRGSVRSSIEPLMMTYFFDAVESDNKVKFVTRGGGQIVVIPEDDLAAHTGDPEKLDDQLAIVRKQEMELPVEVNVSYLNRLIDYQVSTQPSRRLITSAKQTLSINVPIVLPDDQARQVADASMYSIWAGRQDFSFQTSRKYSKYEPTDVLGVVKNSVTHNVRITDKQEGPDGVLVWNGVSEDSSVYSQTGTGVVVGVDGAVAAPIGPTTGLYLDLPLLRDVDDNAGFYYGAIGNADGWRGSKLFISEDDGESYDAVTNGITLSAATAGYALTVLGSIPEDENELVDEYNSVEVKMLSGDVASITYDDLLNRENVAALGGEIIQFRDAELIGVDTYLLTGLLRGRLGSESFIDTHTIGEKFVLLNDNLRSITMPLSKANHELDYKPVSIGRTLQQTQPEPFTNTARRKKPLAPVHVGGGKLTASGGWQFQWLRRTRFDATWTDSIDAPLGETQELYYVDILDPDDELVRRITTSTNSATYTAAEEIEDFGEAKTHVSIVVYQVSAEYGLGYPAAKTIGHVPGYTWSESDKVFMSLANDNLDATATGGGNPSGIRGESSHSSGKKYIEYEIIEDLGADSVFVGFCNTVAGLSSPSPTNGNFKITWRGKVGNIYASGTLVPQSGDNYFEGDVISIAVDITTRQFWCRINGGAWIGGGDPATATTPTGTYSTTEAIFPVFFTDGNSGLKVRIKADLASFVYSMPSGFVQFGE